MANFFLRSFCNLLWQVPFWALTSSESSKSLLLQRPAKYFLRALQRFHPLPNFFAQFWQFSAAACFAVIWRRSTTLCIVRLRPSGETNQLLLSGKPVHQGPPPLLCQPLSPNNCSPFQIQCLQMSKSCFKSTSTPPFWEPVIWSPHPLMGFSITSTLAATYQFLRSPAALIRKNLRLPTRNSKGLKQLVLFLIQNRHGPLLCTLGCSDFYLF